MSHNALRFMSTLAGAIGLVLGVAEHGLAQQMSFAVYSDVTLSGDGNTVYNYGSADDNSSGCTHWNYATTAQLNSPTGRSGSGGSSGLSASTSLAFAGGVRKRHRVLRRALLRTLLQLWCAVPGWEECLLGRFVQSQVYVGTGVFVSAGSIPLGCWRQPRRYGLWCLQAQLSRIQQPGSLRRAVRHWTPRVDAREAG